MGAAEALAVEVGRAGVPTQLVLTWRYRPDVRALLSAVASSRALGGRGRFLTDGFLGGMFATPWRLDRGPLFDLGPHVIDLLVDRGRAALRREPSGSAGAELDRARAGSVESPIVGAARGRCRT